MGVIKCKSIRKIESSVYVFLKFIYTILTDALSQIDKDKTKRKEPETKSLSQDFFSKVRKKSTNTKVNAMTL